MNDRATIGPVTPARLAKIGEELGLAKTRYFREVPR
jgi:hypothetical protein